MAEKPQPLAVDTVPAPHGGSSRLDSEIVQTADTTCKDMEPNYTNDAEKETFDPSQSAINDFIEKAKDTLDWIPRNCTFSHLKVCLRRYISCLHGMIVT